MAGICPRAMSHVSRSEAITENTLDNASPRGLTEKKRQHRAFVIARLILVALFVGFWFTLTPIGYKMPYGFLIALVAEMALLVTCLVALDRVRSSRALDVQHVVLLTGELGCHSAMFYFLGGASWLGAIAFIYAIVYAAVFLSWKQAAFFTVCVCSVFVGIIALDATGTISHQVFLPQDPDRYKNMDYLVPTTVSFIGVMGTLTFWMVFLGSELRRERDVAMRAYDQLRVAQAELRSFNDELEAKVAERTKVLSFRAEHDALTGLLNRGTISRRCQEVLAQAARSGQKVALIVADGDDFKSCNDRVGHGYGDTVLRSLADTLRETSRDSDYVGRLGGDEFLVVLPNTATVGAVRFCRRLMKELETRKDGTEDGLPFPMLSLGLAIYPDHGLQVDELTRVADRAMYAAKAAGGARWRLGASSTDPVTASERASTSFHDEPVPTHAGARKAG
jgi:diguanylate cyclase (GGDEF)-like protein